MDPQKIFLIEQVLEGMDSSSSSSDNYDDDLEDLLLLKEISNELCDFENHAKIRNYVDNVVSLYSDAAVSI